MSEQNEPLYNVVANDEEQYSIWSACEQLPSGWKIIGHAQSREECLQEIEHLWTDMRPKSVREHMDVTCKLINKGREKRARRGKRKLGSTTD